MTDRHSEAMNPKERSLVERLSAAVKDERLSTGALYEEAAERLTAVGKLAYELDGVIADVMHGMGFDVTCLETVKRVRDALHGIRVNDAVLQSERGKVIEECALADVLAERKRQVDVEGWTPEHDDTHDHGELAEAAACYALFGAGNGPWRHEAQDKIWPWKREWWKPTDPRRNLVKATALLLAEIERRDRKQPSISPLPESQQPRSDQEIER